MAETSPDLETDRLPHGYAVEKTVALSPSIRDLIGRIGEAVGPVILETDEEETAPSAKIDELRKDLQEIEELRGELMG